MEFESAFGVMNRMLSQDLMSLSGGPIRRTDPPIPRSRLVQKALLSRLIVLGVMAVSCAVFPKHNPGDDVFQFAFQPPNSNSNRNEDSHYCFCFHGQACESLLPTQQSTNNSTICADAEPAPPPIYLLEKFYQFVLTPLTRWDASRFLQLAVYPSLREPPPIPVEQCIEGNNKDCDQLFLQSEQAHAFFPFLPTVLRTMSRVLLQCIPRRLLPSTYPAVVTLAALLWNTACFALAALALYDLTLYCITQQFPPSVQKERKLPPNYGSRMAHRVFLLFCVNPASVFFTTAYSEATFCFCNFVGHALFLRTQTMIWSLPFWMAASATRSNGTMNAAWILLYGLGIVACNLQQQQQSFKRSYSRTILELGMCIAMALAVCYPLYWHDATGYNRHCTDLGEEFAKPSWCDSPGKFSLYGYVQRQHWNVGIFRYYTLKKIPNFLLAGPILVLSIVAVVDWIQVSFKRLQPTAERQQRFPGNIVAWAMTSLAAFYRAPKGNPALQSDECVFLGPLMLGHYAVLAAVCLIGILVAHVEITTRMICSSCPAIYWYTALCLGSIQESGKKATLAGMVRYTFKGFILPYCLLYNVLGVIMHPNWLPWT